MLIAAAIRGPLDAPLLCGPSTTIIIILVYLGVPARSRTRTLNWRNHRDLRALCLTPSMLVDLGV